MDDRPGQDPNLGAPDLWICTTVDGTTPGCGPVVANQGTCLTPADQTVAQGGSGISASGTAALGVTVGVIAVGSAACFEGALGVVARRAKVEASDAAIDSKVTLTPTGTGGFQLGVELDVSLPSVQDAEVAVELVRSAHEVCPYSNATRGNIEVALTANGRPV